MDWQGLLNRTGQWFLGHGLPILIILVVTLVVLKITSLILDKVATTMAKRSGGEGNLSLVKSVGRMLGWLLKFAVLVVAVVLVLGQLGVDLNPVAVWFRDHGIPILVIVFVTTIALRLATILVGRLGALLMARKQDPEYEKRAKTLSSVVGWLIKVIICGVAFVMILGEVGVDIGPVIAAAGVVGLAVGFGAQTLVQDVITGFFILLEDQIRVGDVVAIGDKAGLVEHVNLRMVILRDAAANVHYIRNGKIDIVTNMTKEFSRYVFNVNVAYRENVDEVIAVLKKIDEELRNDPNFKDDIISPLDVMGLDAFGDSALVIKASITTKPIKQWRIGREFNRRLKQRFDELGIEIPFPCRTVYVGQDKKGQSAPLNVMQTGEGKQE